MAYFGESVLLSAADSNLPEINASEDLSFLLHITNFARFTSAPQIVSSETFHCRGVKFNLTVNSAFQEGYISAFICRSVSEDDFDSMDIVATCEISVLNRDTGNYEQRKVLTHCFESTDCVGFEKWLALKALKLVQAIGCGILREDAMTIRVMMKAEPPHFTSTVSKRLTGYVGIKDPGTTCYLNSVLQTLYFITKFRNACTDNDGDLQLKDVFNAMSVSESAVSTTKLMRGFGWTRADYFMQQDVQEIFRWLIAKAEEKMNRTTNESIVPQLFEGIMKLTVRCLDITFASEREEMFNDIRLNIDEGSKDVYEALKIYLSPSVMDGVNRYDAGEFGLQTAEQCISIVSLPAVLVFHLIRFNYDKDSNGATKINDVFEFGTNLDLSEFVMADQQSDWKYVVCGISP